MVQVRVTLSPLRTARRSAGGCGNSSEGGRGGPIEAQPVNPINVVVAISNSPRESLMCRNDRLHQMGLGCALKRHGHGRPLPNRRNGVLSTCQVPYCLPEHLAMPVHIITLCLRR